ncbi:efflux RND transporter periplasmic adaptor subunit [Rhodosalinus sp. K401]|uniref:efflux RND transporter periplasmic adaptor subunit n=1 Tax=Rhodosalinus sp. K401 TaxID=3239195 RepID=UPI0035269C2B
MRRLSILTALAVAATLYLIVLERDALLQFAGRDAAPGAATSAEGTPGGAAPAAQDTASSTSADASVEAVRVLALRSEARQLDRAVMLRGETEPRRVVEIMAETSGRVIGTPLRKGAMIEEGDVLCRLDPGAREAALDEARARLAEAEARVPESAARVTEARARLEAADLNATAAARLSESGFAAETRVAATRAEARAAEAGLEAAIGQLESVRAGIEAARAAVQSAETEIGRLTIAAPFAGLLDSDTAELGSLMQPGKLCARVLQLDPIRLVGFVPQMSVDRVEPGAPARARFVSGREVEGRVAFVSRSADPETRTFRVEVDLPNPDLSVRAGQTVEIVIAADGEPAHLLPQSALTLDDDGRLGVRVVDADNRARFAPVTLLRDTVDGVWIAGLPDTAAVIVRGQEYVTDGVRVRPEYREAEATQ